MNLNKPIAFSISDACSVSGLSKSTIYEEIAKGALRARKLGSRTFIMADDLKAWLESQPEAHITYTKS